MRALTIDRAVKGVKSDIQGTVTERSTCVGLPLIGLNQKLGILREMGERKAGKKRGRGEGKKGRGRGREEGEEEREGRRGGGSKRNGRGRE